MAAIRTRIFWSPSLGGTIPLRERTATLPAADLLQIMAYYQAELTWGRALEAAVQWRERLTSTKRAAKKE